ncbi:arsenite methyltransferase [Candidatus Viridilinea mediisalina]|uniref:Arsenite methyltransferase n=1 Tax=Candidatus Viridilinea mediisalina TaxID=2024553 RepID=A0A2A6RPS5_9CHLR|nr:arsenite methyltransferase [Candidatus Viridilinea mediisalina]PDW04933.1 methyltransferase type 11 [Candidatus Viridilinea mediisalina]
MRQTIPDSSAIKAAVQEHYGQAITRGSCCTTDTTTSTEVQIYGAETLARLPEGVVTTSFGCGNALALATLQPGEVVLDLGSGGGLEVILAAQQVGPDGFVYGLDMTDAMLETARRNAARVGATNVSFLKGDIEAIPLPDQSVDVIISNCVINLVPDKAQVLNDAFRVLRPGGRLAVSDIVFDGDLTAFPLPEATIRSALSWSSCFAGALTMDDYRNLLEAAGFTAVNLEVLHRYTVADLRNEGSEMLEGLPAELLPMLEGRVTSCAISARRPPCKDA